MNRSPPKSVFLFGGFFAAASAGSPRARSKRQETGIGLPACA
jgi:hypothetical protein